MTKHSPLTQALKFGGKLIIKYNGIQRRMNSITLNRNERKIVLTQLELYRYSISNAAISKLTPLVKKHLAASLGVNPSTLNKYLKANKINGPLTTIAALMVIEKHTKLKSHNILITTIETRPFLEYLTTI